MMQPNFRNPAKSFFLDKFSIQGFITLTVIVTLLIFMYFLAPLIGFLLVPNLIY